METLAWLVKRFLFPAWLALAVITAHMLYRRGMAPTAIVTGIAVASLVLVTLMERLMPYRSQWNRGQGDTSTDLLSFGLIAGVFDPLWKTLGAMLALWLTNQSGLYIWPLFPAEMALPLQIVLVFLIAEFGKYWAHRWHHESRLLWQLHAMHHVSKRLYVLNNFKLHPVNLLIGYLFGLFPLALIGTPTEPLTIYTAVFLAVTFFQHANIDLRFGPLNYVFSTNALHRWHHSRSLPEGNRNYGSVLIIWDLVFGTWHYPADKNAPDAIGIADSNYPEQGYLRQVLWPITSRLRCCVT